MNIKEYIWNMEKEDQLVERLNQLIETDAPGILLYNQIKQIYCYRQKIVRLEKINLYGQLDFVHYYNNVFELPDGNKIEITGNCLIPQKPIYGLIAQNQEIKHEHLCRYVKKYLYKLKLIYPNKYFFEIEDIKEYNKLTRRENV
jgi:hypothetical protein